jgi:hypothetical protein
MAGVTSGDLGTLDRVREPAPLLIAKRGHQLPGQPVLPGRILAAQPVERVGYHLFQEIIEVEVLGDWGKLRHGEALSWWGR